jgi:hypothetical protein
MKKIFLLTLIITSFVMLAGCSQYAYGCRGESITVTGTIRLVGNEPFTELVIETDDKELYEIVGDKKKELSQKQGVSVVVSGKIVKPTGISAKKAIDVQKYNIILK